MNSTISVIIPSYNRAHFISDSLESIYAQSYRPLEIIIVDDGSTDATHEVIAAWVKRRRSNTDDPQEKLSLHRIVQENSGPSSARNRGFAKSTGSYIHFMDSDDFIHPELYTRAITMMRKTGSDLCHFGMHHFDGSSPFDGFNAYCPPNEANLLDAFFLNKLLGFGWGFIRTRTLCETVGNWDESLKMIAEDKDYCFRCLLHASKTCNIVDPLYFLREHATGRLNTNRNSLTRWEGIYRQNKIMLDYLKLDYDQIKPHHRSQYRAQMFNLAIHAYSLGYNELANRFGKLAIELRHAKISASEKRMELIFKLGPHFCRIWQKCRLLKRRQALHRNH